MQPDGTHEPTLSAQVAALHARLLQLTELGPSTEADGVLLAELSSAHEELRVADEELRAQQEELDRLLELRARGRGSQEQLIARLPAPVVVTDAHGAIRFANAAAGALFATRLQALARKPLFAFVDPSERLPLRQLLVRAVADDDAELQARVGFILRDRDPVVLDVAATLQRSYDAPGGVEVTWVLLGDNVEGTRSTASSEPILARTLVDLARLPLDLSEPKEVAHRTALLCQEAFPVPVRVSITIGDPLTPEYVASDSQEAQAVDGAQLMAGEGPCVDAWRTVSRVSTGDMQTDDRWPRLPRYLGDIGLRSAVAAPLVVGDGPFGVLNVYATSDDLHGELAREIAELLASTAASVLQEVSMRLELEEVAAHLRTALDSRATIDQAKGIVMARHGCNPEEAFRILAKISSNSNVKLREIAANLVAEASAGR